MIFSIIVPFLNEASYIDRCIRSLLNQDFDQNEYELIFIDNGSTDGSVEIVRQFPKIHLIYEKHKNPYTARNSAIMQAKGEIIAFTDADCVVDSAWLQAIYAEMQKNTVSIVLGRVNFPSRKNQLVSFLEDYQNAKIQYLIQYWKQEYLYGYTNNMAVRASLFEELGFFLEWPVPGDTEFIHRYVRAYPHSKIGFLRDMEVMHLEIAKFSSWIKKSIRYGSHNILVSKYSDYRPFTLKLVFSIYKHCTRHNRYGTKQKLLLSCCVAVCGLTYAAGMLKGWLRFSI